MQFSFATLISTILATTSTNASPTPTNTSSPTVGQGGPWSYDHCDHSIVGIVAGTSYIKMLRNSWQIKFANFGSTPVLDKNKIQGTCCAGQCLWVSASGQPGSWNETSWNDALHRLINVVKSGNSGLCGANIDGNEYLTLFTADGISPAAKDGRAILDVIGNSCEGGEIPWPEVYHG